MSLLKRMGDYTLWADTKIWKIVKELTDEEFCCTFNDNSGSIRDRYLHMALGHSYWYTRWIDSEHEEIEIEKMSREDLFEHINRFNQLIMDLIHSNNFDATTVSIGSGDTMLCQDEMIFNIINHATYHRGQIVVLLRMLGKDVKATDYVPYLIEKGPIS
jgi:uncharacterized damage-inducible protein DinB